jgi:hypothetical protein
MDPRQYQQTLNLQQLMSASNDGTQHDNTEYIRQSKISQTVRTEVDKLLALKAATPVEKHSQDEFFQLCIQECGYLHSTQLSIFYRIIRDELDISLLYRMLDALKSIEDGETTQHEASVNVGQMATDLFVGSAKIAAERRDAAAAASAPKPREAKYNLSYEQYKILGRIKERANANKANKTISGPGVSSSTA